MPLILVYNPICGDGTAKSFFHETVIPLLERHERKIDRIIETEYSGHAGNAIADTLLDTKELLVTVVLGSGDGTLHEIINTLASTTHPTGQTLPKINFVLVPCGTANALFYSLFPPDKDSTTLSDPLYRCRSLDSYIKSEETIPLTLAISTLSPHPSSKDSPKATVSAVVTSTSLHAAILNDSEQLRAEHPGIERFKVAARQNSDKWYSASVKLLPVAELGVVQIYESTSQKFVNHPDSSQDDPIVDLEGPFVYFLSTVNVDRLESAFRITPLVRAILPPKGTCELVIVRPLRDPANSEQDTTDARTSFVPKIWTILGSAYDNGAHVSSAYNSDGEIIPAGEGLAVVEYVRCGGWEWIPDDSDKNAHLLCSDGDIWHIEEGGRVVCVAATPQDLAGFAVHI